jgi:6-phosphogluconolactonase/glucosamine-6-phosphate isomerase/deaminase
MLPTLYCLSSSQVLKAAGGALADLSSGSEACLFLLSGGSAIGCYGSLVTALQTSHGRLAFGLIDERFGPVDHADSNALAIEQATELWSICDQRHIESRTMLEGGGSLEQAAERYQTWLRAVMVKFPRRVAVLGIGTDGHTAGILPMTEMVFGQTFDDVLVAGYELDTGLHRQRITLSPQALLQCTDIVVIAMGETKKPALEQLMSAKEMPLWQFPVGLLRRHSHVQIFTDVKV